MIKSITDTLNILIYIQKYVSEYRTSTLNWRYKKFLVQNVNENPYVSINVGYDYSIRFYNSAIDWIDVVSLYKGTRCILSYKSKSQVQSQINSKTFVSSGSRSYNSNYFSSKITMVTPLYLNQDTHVLNAAQTSYEKVDVFPFTISEDDYFFQTVLYDLPPYEHIQYIKEVLAGCDFWDIPKTIYSTSNISFYNTTFDDIIELDLNSEDFKLFSEKMKEVDEGFSL